ncbi:PadR family transcriptional regulator [Clostridia bacterium]|nr:PadR family transcriptional regulator [Clostridia bacterium]
MEIQFKKGLLDAYVLAVLKRGDTYGYKLFSDINENLEISESTLYPILRRLESANCLTTYNVEYGGRLRKYYRLTGEGFVRLEEYKRQCCDVKRIIDLIFS